MISSSKTLSRIISNARNSQSLFEGVFKKSDEEFFLDIMKTKLGHKFNVLRMMAKNHGVEVDVEHILADVMAEIHGQVDRKMGREAAEKLVKLVFLDKNNKQISIPVVESEESFKKNFKVWCEDFVKTLNHLKKDFSWLDVKSIVKKVACVEI